jgi:hypothetical protein
MAIDPNSLPQDANALRIRPDRKPVPVPVQDLEAVFSLVGEQVQMSGEGVQMQMVFYQGVQTVKTTAHVARAQTQIHPHAGRQVNHPRTASRTMRSVAASTSLPIRSRSPFPSTSSSAEAVLPVSIALVSSSANRTEPLVRSRFLQ